ncbi:MAG: hypothetical protein JNL95_00365 [Chitinophagales bacterium]|nr:hypothetical protein [Chitinophagales bacterium]
MKTSPSIAERCVVFLERNRLLNSVLIVLYVLLILHGHDFFVQLSVKAMNSVSLPVYNQVVMLCIVTCSALLVLYTLYMLNTNPIQWKVRLLFLAGCLLYLSIHVNVLFEMNIEIIHVVEYIVLSFLLFPFTRSISATLIFALPIMIGDELNQYLILYPGYNKYFEWSDIVMDIIGAGTLLLMLNIAGLQLRKRTKYNLFTPEILLLVVFCLFMLFGFITGMLVSTAKDLQPNTIFVFNQLSQPELFWQTHAFTGAHYHVLWPSEGVVLILVLCAFFALYDKLASN